MASKVTILNCRSPPSVRPARSESPAGSRAGGACQIAFMAARGGFAAQGGEAGDEGGARWRWDFAHPADPIAALGSALAR
jgi:hypothetical protein